MFTSIQVNGIPLTHVGPQSGRTIWPSYMYATQSGPGHCSRIQPWNSVFLDGGLGDISSEQRIRGTFAIPKLACLATTEHLATFPRTVRCHACGTASSGNFHHLAYMREQCACKGETPHCHVEYVITNDWCILHQGIISALHVSPRGTSWSIEGSFMLNI